jgi:hypothetical protein
MDKTVKIGSRARSGAKTVIDITAKKFRFRAVVLSEDKFFNKNKKTIKRGVLSAADTKLIHGALIVIIDQLCTYVRG